MSTEYVIAGFTGLFSVVGVLAVFILNVISTSLKTLNANVESLNHKMSVIVERVDYHEKRIDRLEGPRNRRPRA